MRMARYRVCYSEIQLKDLSQRREKRWGIVQKMAQISFEWESEE